MPKLGPVPYRAKIKIKIRVLVLKLKQQQSQSLSLVPARLRGRSELILGQLTG